MKRKLLMVPIILCSLLIFPLVGFELYNFTLGPLRIERAGYFNIISTSKDDDPLHEYYFKNKGANYIEIDLLPEYVSSYLVALEDQGFYSHNGFDLGRTIKSAIDNITSGKTKAGGSTISQQLARLLFLSNDKSLTRKIDELGIARRLERGMTKKKILELYLNEAYFGEDLYGIESASMSFFSKSCIYLTESEAALLISLLPSPNNYSPRKNLKLSTERYMTALKNLYYRDAISPEEFYEFSSSFPLVNQIPNAQNPAVSYYQAIDSTIKNQGFNTRSEEIEVNSYIDYKMQLDIDEIVKSFEKDERTEAAVVVMEPRTGIVRTLIGGIDDQSFNRATNASKAIGSTVKPIIYTIALENGFTPQTSFLSKPTTFYLDDGVKFNPTNVLDLYANRKIEMTEALALSDNIYATKLMLMIGSASLSERLDNIDLKIAPNVTNALGSFSLSPLELASIYNALGNNGYYQKPKFYSSFKIEGRTFSSENNGVQLFRSDKSRMMSYLLRSTQDPALKTYSSPTMLYYPLTHRFAVKTGSTPSSSYVVGYNPQYTICIYVGTDDNNETLKDTNLAKKIFQKTANKIMENKADEFYSPEGFTEFTYKNTITNKESFTYYR